MSPDLETFYSHYARWLEAGAPDGQSFSRRVGLCNSLKNWCLRQGVIWHRLYRELEDQFIDAGLDSFYPFNKGASDYDRERNADAIHLNPKRIAWVKGYAK